MNIAVDSMSATATRRQTYCGIALAGRSMPGRQLKQACRGAYFCGMGSHRFGRYLQPRQHEQITTVPIRFAGRSHPGSTAQGYSWHQVDSSTNKQADTSPFVATQGRC